MVLQQQEVCKATIKTLKAANTVITRAKKYAAGCGLFYPPLKLPLKMNAVHDSSHATKESAYAQEGVLILLMHDGDLVFANSDSPLFNANILSSRTA